MTTIIFAAIAYALGSVNTATIICKLMGYPDPSTEGSKNPGATNVLRVAGKQAAAIVLVADFLKGTIPVWFGVALGLSPFGLGLIALAATAGHIFPAFFNFKGGKGVATGLGAIFGISFFVGVVSIIAWVAVVYLKKIVSLASLIAIATATLLILFVAPGAFIPVVGIAALVGWRHMDNIERLKSGTENKIEL